MSLYSDNLLNHLEYIDDFLNVSGDLNWTITQNADGTQISLGESGHPGISRFQIGTGNTNAYASTRGTNAMTFGYGSVVCHNLVRFPSTGTSGTNNYTIVLGASNTQLTYPPTNGVYFEYNTTGNGNSLVAVTTFTGTQTKTVTPITINTGSWYLASFSISPDASKVDFSINNSLVATHTTNIPTGISGFCGQNFSIVRTTGTTNQGVLDVDLHVFSIYNLNTIS